MKPDQERVRDLLTDTVTLLCKNGLQYQKELRVQGLLGITLDDRDVFVVHINETFGDLLGGAISIRTGDEENDKLSMADVGGDDVAKHGDTTGTVAKFKYHQNSNDSLSSPVQSPGIHQRPMKRLMTSTPHLKRPEKRASKSTWGPDNDDVPSATSTPLTEPGLGVRVKIERDDVVIVDDKEHVQTCDRVTFPDASATDQTHGQYGHFVDSLDFPHTSTDPGGGDEAEAHLTQDYYNENDQSETKFNVTDPGFAGSSTHGTVYTSEGHSMVNPGCSTWDPSQGRFTTNATDDNTETMRDTFPICELFACEHPDCERIFRTKAGFIWHQVQKHDRPRSRPRYHRRCSKGDEKAHFCRYPGCNRSYYMLKHLKEHQKLKHSSMMDDQPHI